MKDLTCPNCGNEWEVRKLNSNWVSCPECSCEFEVEKIEKEIDYSKIDKFEEKENEDDVNYY